MKKFISLLIAAMMVFSVSACSSGAKNNVAQTSEKTPIDTFIVGTTAEITSANRSEYNFDVLSGAISQLAPVRIDEEGNFQPLLCDFTTEDSKTWKLTVRDGMTWHDGQPVTAEDIAFTLQYLDTQTDGGYASSYADIRVIDEKTIELELPEANPRQLSELTTLRIMPKHIYDGVADYTTVPNEQANIGCGPYKFSRYDADAGVIEFTANEAYPDGKPTANNLIIKLYDNADTMYMALKSGDIDMVYKYSGGVDAAVIEDLQSSGNLTLMPVSNTANSAVLIFNNNTEPFNNSNIRKAVVNAIDYAKFRETFGSSYAIPSTAGFIPAGTNGYVETDELVRNVDAAKKYLEDAGCKDTDGDGFVEYNGSKLSFPVMLRGDKPEHARYAELLKNNLAEVGIDVELDVEEVANFRDLTEKQHAQTAVITGLTPFGMAKNQGMASLYIWGENSMGYGQVFDENYKALLDKADAAVTMDEYKKAAGEIQKYYAETLPSAALFWDKHVQAYNSRFDGFVVDGTFGIINVETWLNLSETPGKK
ncbi:MAG: ABC transporter substrate-binding protein [Candidatus Metalachnospira sp.]|nr:ABC transporter substrate-binding protein [Candidatus Metalachnospira sp.]